MSEERLVHLEGRFAWMERHLAEQDRVILELTESVRQLRAELGRLRERAEGAEGPEGGPGAGPIDERPPHS